MFTNMNGAGLAPVIVSERLRKIITRTGRISACLRSDLSANQSIHPPPQTAESGAEATPRAQTEKDCQPALG